MPAPDEPFLTADLPGTGGTLKTVPEDFIVEEIPAYEPIGSGEHLFLRIEKRDLSHEQLLDHLCRALHLRQRDIGAAGMKDRRAITRQWVSVPATCEEQVDSIEGPGVRLLEAALHTNKLKTGHLRGNRFRIVIRDVAADAIGPARQIVERLLEFGFPNFFGRQRFGRDDDTLRLGRDLIAGRSRPEELPPARQRFLTRLSLSAVQSQLFNEVLAERVRDGLLPKVLYGDVMQVTGSGGRFLVTAEAIEQERFNEGETVTTGPLFGPKMMEPLEEPAEREARVLARHGLSVDDFARFAKLCPGTRRPLLVRPRDLSIAECEHGLELTVTLPSGCYATVLLREFLRTTDDAVAAKPPAEATTGTEAEQPPADDSTEFGD